MGFPKGLSALFALLLATGHSHADQACSTPLNQQLLVAEEGKIFRVNPSNKNDRETLVLSPSVIGLDYSYARNTLYFCDTSSRQVHALKDQSTKAKIAVPRQENWLPVSVAVDDVTDKLYVSDAFTGAINVFDLQNGNHGIVIGSNLTQPRRIVLDTKEGYLFVLDKFQILRTEVDGSNPQTIYSEYISTDDIYGKLPIELKSVAEALTEDQNTSEKFRSPVSVADIVLNPEEKRIYWVNSLTREIKSANYNGKDRKVHFQDRSVEGVSEAPFSSLTFLDGKLYWSDDVTQKIYKIDVNDEDKVDVFLDGVQSQVVKAISCSDYQKKQNPCSVDNGLCQHLCVLSRNNIYGFRCACNVGYELEQNSKSCQRVEDFLLFVQDDYLKGRSLHPQNEGSVDVINPSQFQVGSSAQVDFDAADGKIFFTSNFPNDQLHQANLVNGEQTKLQPDFMSKNVRFISYDWISKNLYYVTYYYADMNSLSVLNVRDPTYSKILVKHIPRLVRAVAVHPNKGYVYFARLDDEQNPRESSISRMNTDGSDLKILLRVDPDYSIDSLAVDYSENRLYWSESKRVLGNRIRWEVRLRHSNLDGSDIRVLWQSTEQVGSITFDKNHVYLTVNEQRLISLDKKSGRNSETLVESEEMNSLNEAKLFSRRVQSTDASRPCAVHDCQKFCFAVPTADAGALRAKCDCPYGERIAEDGKTCVDNGREEPMFLPCKYTSFKCNAKTAPVL